MGACWRVNREALSGFAFGCLHRRGMNMLKSLPTALLGLTLATGALAESTTMSKAIQAGSLHEGPLDMVAYWIPLEDEGYEVTATFIGRVTGNEPMRVVMKLEEGDEVAFSMPGHQAALYRFTRSGDVVEASVDLAGDRVASN